MPACGIHLQRKFWGDLSEMQNMLIKNELNGEQLAILKGEMDKKAKSKTTMYLMWFFLGVLGGHRFYLGDIGMGVAMLFTLGGLGVWALIDVFFIGKRCEAKNEALELEIIQQIKSMQKEPAATI